MKGKIGILAILLVGLLAFCGLAYAIPSTIIEKVEVEGTELDTAGTTRLDVERGEDISVKIWLQSNVDLEDVEVEAFISGYEYNDKERMSDTTHIFDMDTNVTYVKKLKLTLPSKVEEDNYKLRIIVSDRDGEEVVQKYSLKIDVKRHLLTIKDVVLSPEGTVQAGRALLATVRVKNIGEKDEESVKVKISIPELGISASDYIDEIEADESESSEELYLRIPTCSDAGTYVLKADVEYDEGYETVSKEMAVDVAEGEACEAVAPTITPTTPQTIIGVGATTQDVTAGAGGVIYPLTITNAGATSRTYTIAVSGAEDWADVRISPSNTLIIDAGESKSVFVYVSAKDTASAGSHMFAVEVSSGGESLKEITLSANVAVAKAPTSSLRRSLEVGLVVLVILLVILGLIIGFNKLKGSEEEEESAEAGQTYY
jgi:uncharacterized membrane protein